MFIKRHRPAPIKGSASGISREGTVWKAPFTGLPQIQAVCPWLISERHGVTLELPEAHFLLRSLLTVVNGELKQSNGNQTNLYFLQRVFLPALSLLIDALLWPIHIVSSFLSV